MPPGSVPDGVLIASIPAACRTHAPIAMHHDTTTSGLRDTIEHAAHLLPAQGPIEVFIHRLRRKLEDSGLSIRTVRGLGYLLEPDTTRA